MKEKILNLIIILVFGLALKGIAQSSEPCGAVGVLVGTSCDYVTYDNSQLSDSGVEDPSCGSYLAGSTEDAWFKVVVPSTGELEIDLDEGTITDASMAVYTGSSCNNLSELVCDDDASTNGNMPYLHLTNLTPGQTIWIRVWEYGGNLTGTFDMCVFTTFDNLGDNCSEAEIISALPFTDSGTTCGSVDDYDNTNACGGKYWTGEDYVYKYTPTQDELITVEMNSSFKYGGFFILDDCPDNPDANCIASAKMGNSHTLNLSCIPLFSGQTYYFILDSWSLPNCLPYTLEITTSVIRTNYITNCSGFFTDSGGNSESYSPCENITTIICPEESGDVVRLNFTSWSVEAGNTDDHMTIYDGDNTSAPVLVEGNALNPLNEVAVQASLSNPTGCLTVVWESDDDDDTGAGWLAEISCLQPCQIVVANLATTSPNAVMGYIDICKGESIDFSAFGTYPNNGTAYFQNDETSIFTWDFDDQQIVTGQNVSHTFTEEKGYVVNLQIEDVNGCVNTNSLGLKVRVSTTPDFSETISTTDPVCLGDCSEITGQAESTPWETPVGEVLAGVTFLPDGSGVSYTTSLFFDDFSIGSTVEDVNDIQKMCAMIEHAYAGDLDIVLKCPNGNQVTLVEYASTGDNINADFLGEPIDDDNVITPGIGYNYCWSPTGIETWDDAADGSNVYSFTDLDGNVYTNHSYIPAGTYDAMDDWSNLIGCPLNGSWSIIVTDHLIQDNGYIFEWGIYFDPSLYPAGWGYTPIVNSGTWSGTTVTNANPTIACPPDLGSEIYTYTVTDNFGCSYDTNITIQATGISVSTDYTNPTCAGSTDGIVSVTSVTGNIGNLTYDWDMIAGTNNPASVGGLSAGSYTVTVRDAGSSCVFTETIQLTDPLPLDLNLSVTDAICGGATGVISATVTNGVAPFDYTWMPGATANNQASTYDISNLLYGNYGVTVTDSNGCEVSSLGSVQDVGEVDADIVPVSNQCLEGNSFSFDASNSIYMSSPVYNWSFGNGTTADNGGVSVTNSYSLSGTYDVSLTIIDGTCSDVHTISVVVFDTPTINTIVQDISCNGLSDGQIQISMDNGVPPLQDVLWSPIAETTTTASGLNSGNYSVQFRDANGCLGILSGITVSEPDNVIINTNPTDVTCYGVCNGAAQAIVSSGGTPPYTYSWGAGSSPNGANLTVGLCVGNYTVTVVDSNLCEYTQTVNLSEPGELLVSEVLSSHTNISCMGNSTGALEVQASGGTLPYQYSINGGIDWQTSSGAFLGLSEGIYTVNVKDANGCQKSINIVISEPETLTLAEIIANHQNVSCYGSNNGSFTVQASGGTSPYQYSIDGITWQTISGVFSDLISTDYDITVVDDLGCQATTSVTITEVSEIRTTIFPSSTSCNGVCDAQGVISVIGGSGDFLYSWDNITADVSASTQANLCADDSYYYVQVCDVEDPTCCVIDSLQPTQPDEIVINTISQNSNCGQSDGSVNVNSISGGSGVFSSYLWENALGVSQSITSLPALVSNISAGNYYVTVTDNNGCIGTASQVVGDNLAGTIVVDTILDVNCNGGNDGSVFISTNGMTEPLTISWNGPYGFTNSNKDISELFSGNYSVSIKDAVNCVVSTNAFVNQPQVITAVAQVVSNVSCYGADDGSVQVVVNGGIVSSGYTYQWYDDSDNPIVGQTGQIATNLPAGNYCVIVSDNASSVCQKISNFVTVIQPTPLVASASVFSNYNGKDVSCKNICDGQAIVSVSGSSGSYSYLWSNSSADVTATTISNLCGDGTVYYVSVSDMLNPSCRTIASVSLTEPTEMNLVSDKDDAHCGQEDGLISVEVTGGTPQYVYNFENSLGQTLSITSLPSVVEGVGAGEYVALVSDANGCEQTLNITVDDMLGSDDIAITAIDASVFGMCDGSATVSMTGAVSYQWYSDNTYVNPINQTGATAINLCATEYCVKVTDLVGCSDQICITVDEPDSISIESVVVHNNCYSDCNGEINITPSGGLGAPYTYDWSHNGSVGFPGTDTEDLTGLCAGTYTVSVYDANGSMSSKTFVIEQPQELTASPIIVSNYNGMDISCYGASDGSVDLTVTGGTPNYSYNWSGPDSYVGSSNEDISNLAMGTYFVTVEDLKGCRTLANIHLGQPESIILNAIADTDAHCGQADGKITHLSTLGGTEPYSYEWFSNIGLSVGQGLSAENLSSGLYLGVVTDVNGCTESTTVPVLNIPEGTSVITTVTPSCVGLENGTATISISSGGGSNSYIWSNGDTTAIATQLSAGVLYEVTATDVWGCEVIDQVTLSDPLPISNMFSNIVSLSCSGGCSGSVKANPVGGTQPYLFQWDDLALSNSDKALNLCSGWYHVTITDAYGCSIVDSIEFVDPPAMSLSADITHVNCNQHDGAINLSITNANGNLFYDWDIDGIGDNDDNQNLSNMASGNYYVIVTDMNACSIDSVFIIEDMEGPTAFISDTVMVDCYGNCNGSATISVSGGTPPYIYNWSESTGNQLASTATNLCVGNYQATVMDANGCSVPLSVGITEPDILVANLIPTNPLCNGGSDGSVDVIVSGGTPFISNDLYQFQWDNTDQTAPNITSLEAGAYELTTTDANNCYIVNNTMLYDPPFIGVDSITYVEPSCYSSSNGSATIYPNGGTVISGNYKYEWFDSNNMNIGQYTQTASGLSGATYTVVVTDDHACSESFSVNLPQPVEMNVSLVNHQDPLCKGSSDGYISISVSGGSPNYSFLWNDGISSQNRNNLSANAYEVTVTDLKGCDAVTSFILSDPEEVLISLNGTGESCYEYNDGAISTTVTGGTGDYSYIWSAEGGSFVSNQQNLSGLSGSNSGEGVRYYVTVQDDNSCTDTASYIVDRPPMLMVDTVFTSASNCGQSNGSAEVMVMGGTTPIQSYQWQNSIGTDWGSTLLAEGMYAGNYVFIVTDANGCQADILVSISDIGGPTIESITSTPDSCGGIPYNGTTTVSISGGVPPFSYLWNDNDQQQLLGTPNLEHTANNLSGGVYSVQVTDAAGCITAGAVEVFEPENLTAWISYTLDVKCYQGSDGWALVQHFGGVPPYSYNWNDDNSQTTSQADNLIAGNYTVTVADNLGCSSVASVVINQPQQPLGIALNIQDPLCYNDTNGVISVQAVGGTPFYYYSWGITGIEDVSSVGQLGVGVYYLSITDANDCSIDTIIEVHQPEQISLSYSTVEETCDANNAEVNIDLITGGTPSYNIYLNPDNEIVEGANNAHYHGLASGSYNVLITDNHNCMYSQAINVERVKPPIINLESCQPTRCYGTDDGQATVSVINGTPPYTYSWANGENEFTAFNLSFGTHTVEIIDANGCTDSQNVMITQPDPINIIATVLSDTVCINQPTYLSVVAEGGTPGYQYYWFEPDIGTGQAVLVYPSINQIYKVYAVDNNYNENLNGCTSDTVDVLLHTYPFITTSLVDSLSSCEGDSVSTTVSVSGGNGGPYTYLWSNSLVDSVFTIKVDNKKFYYVSVSDMCATPTAIDSLYLNVDLPPKLTDISSTNGCEPHMTEIDAFATSSDSNITYQWNFEGEITEESESGDATYIYNQSGTYYPVLTLNSAKGCSKDTAIEVVVYPSPVADFSMNKAITDRFESEIEFYNNSTIITDEKLINFWDFGDGYYSQNFDPIHMFQSVGEYTVKLAAVSLQGCIDSTERIIKINDRFVIYFPNTFSPGYGNLNNYFYPKGLGASSKDYLMEIYNRWGELVFRTIKLPKGFDDNSRIDVEGGWNGRYKNSQEYVKPGVYIWKVKVKDVFGVDHEYSGTVNVIR